MKAAGADATTNKRGTVQLQGEGGEKVMKLMKAVLPDGPLSQCAVPWVCRLHRCVPACHCQGMQAKWARGKVGCKRACAGVYLWVCICNNCSCKQAPQLGVSQKGSAHAQGVYWPPGAAWTARMHGLLFVCKSATPRAASLRSILALVALALRFTHSACSSGAKGP